MIDEPDAARDAPGVMRVELRIAEEESPADGDEPRTIGDES
jgi:hypothetical protein